ncbi:LLM class F420-dependent oxidoreductase [Fodinicola feengrottensis]|uniref:TIGR03621 family F420-dependent LLM class oxidoreductase n=1 Tax=Fodinicola feengrottensis TaxID=435914 RepID=A0ABP4SZ69_9ACTN|nr:LLM class F420-dependent oxidoreductase [Fodinicola feengrottensis]
MTQRAFRFGLNTREIDDRERFVERCRWAERSGFDTLHLPDHLQAPSPFPVMMAAADATERLRVGTLVLNIGFWNPALLAREVASVDRLSGGRLELGLGAGHMKSEFDQAGIEWEPVGKRTDRLRDTIIELDRLLTDLDHRPAVVQRPRPPLLLAGTGDGMLEVAAEHADIFGYGGLWQQKGQPPGTFRLATAAETDERIGFIRERAGDRFDQIELNVLVQAVEITDDRDAAVARLAADTLEGMPAEEILRTPMVLVGTVQQIVDQLHERRDRYGFSYISVHQHLAEKMAHVIDAVK